VGLDAEQAGDLVRVEIIGPDRQAHREPWHRAADRDAVVIVVVAHGLCPPVRPLAETLMLRITNAAPGPERPVLPVQAA
jgi:hypothetical protein